MTLLIAACPMFERKQLLPVLLYVARRWFIINAAMFVCRRINTDNDDDEDDSIGTRPPGRPARYALETHTLGGRGKFFTASEKVENGDVYTFDLPRMTAYVDGCILFFWEWTVTTLPPLQRILIARIDEALQQSLCATPQVICLASVGRSPWPPREHAVSARGT